jgi:two-component system sensor histidine kinase KdpD
MVAVVLGVTIETVGCWLFLRSGLHDVVMVYLLGVAVAALLYGRVASVATAIVSVGVIDFFFTIPVFSFAVEDRRLLVTFVVFVVIGCVIGDLAERVRRAIATARERELEARNERVRSALLASVSHDLRAPLAVIIDAACALLDGEEEAVRPARREHILTIADESVRLSRLVRHLIHATSLESGVVRVQKEWMPLEEIVGVALSRLEDSLGGRALDVRIDAEASMVSADATLLEQLFLNLLENAAKYTPPRTPVSISARQVEEGVEVAVADSGDGVPAGLEERIFEKFERAATGGGMGLGLTICRGIVAAHGGRIWCENVEGGGAIFRFVLPRGELPQMVEE